MSFFKSIAAPIVAVGAICGVIAATAPSAESKAQDFVPEPVTCVANYTDANTGRRVERVDAGYLTFTGGEKFELSIFNQTTGFEFISGHQLRSTDGSLWFFGAAQGGFVLTEGNLNLTCMHGHL